MASRNHHALIKQSTTMISDGSNDEEKAAILAENSSRTKIMSDEKF